MKISVKMEHSRLILKHLPRLLGSTRCTEALLEKAHVNDILTHEETQILEKLSLGYERNFDFWYFIRRKENWNSKLTEIFRELGQTGVTSILLQIEKEIVPEDKYTFIRDSKTLVVKDHYTLRSNKIGLSLIINITDYDFEENRAHAQQDASNISELFNQLGYKVTKCEGRLSEKEIDCFFESLFQQFTIKPFLQSCVVYIGSHGSDNAIILSDGTVIDLHAILLRFSKCEQLNGKPKLFILQSSGINVPYIRDKLQGMKDTAIFVSSQNNAILQSFSIYTFTEIFMREARRSELKEMLYKVKSSVRSQLQLSVSDKDVPAYTTFDMQPLYFNVEP